MPTPSKYNYFELSFKIIVTMMVLAISITVFVLKVNDARHSHPIVKHTASKSALWEKAGFYIWDNDRENGQQIVTLNNRVILNNNSKVVALDGQTGKELWTYRGVSVDGLAISPTTVFVGAEYVTALDVEAGDVLWSTRMPHGRGAVTLHIQGDTLYADDGSLLYGLLNTQTGEVLDEGRFSDGEYPPSEIYPARELQAAHSLFGIDTVIGNTGYSGSIRGMIVSNIPNGNILWRYEISLISPIAVAGKSIYAISENGKLMRFDTATGAASVMISYTPAPLARLTKDEADLYNNFVAVDPTSNMGYVYLGDSETLMAYQLKP